MYFDATTVLNVHLNKEREKRKRRKEGTGFYKQ